MMRAKQANLVVIPMCSGSVPEDNFRYLTEQLNAICVESPTLVCLPEAWLAFCANGSDTFDVAQSSDVWIEKISQLCKEKNIWLHAGTIPIQATGEKYYAASCLFDDQGQLVAQYNKIHLFDADVSDQSKRYRESDFTEAGSEVVVVDSPFGRLGLSVCYDMRFAGLYQVQRAQQANILLVPSAFTTVTGEAHWLPLLQARAIETQCFVIAAAQVGLHQNGRETYGHSVIISPWGEVLDDSMLSLQPIQRQLDFTELYDIRHAMPVFKHNRFKSNMI
ncbi:amidohydrolase [Pseudoalteromonas luteoviolacea]|uniref:Amidohydrolase n=2 Tax=Pseudoalteromonas luteoviolacea TaxID=43657 RepID=A0A0C1QB30_9GAMM|nr:carbon-nitrogen hydrolase family protein [Pseudoalteromonas luteoviolacea]KID57856.1 amidohydrolase [Pseudoalteromonas luteoviolacea]